MTKKVQIIIAALAVAALTACGGGSRPTVATPAAPASKKPDPGTPPNQAKPADPKPAEPKQTGGQPQQTTPSPAAQPTPSASEQGKAGGEQSRAEPTAEASQGTGAAGNGPQPTDFAKKDEPQTPPAQPQPVVIVVTPPATQAGTTSAEPAPTTASEDPSKVVAQQTTQPEAPTSTQEPEPTLVKDAPTTEPTLPKYKLDGKPYIQIKVQSFDPIAESELDLENGNVYLFCHLKGAEKTVFPSNLLVSKEFFEKLKARAKLLENIDGTFSYISGNTISSCAAFQK